MTATLTLPFSPERHHPGVGNPNVDPLLAAAAAAFALLVLPTVAALLLDDRLFLGIGIWIKPLKFEIALTLYLATLALYARWLPSGIFGRRWYRAYIGAVVLACAFEILVIGGAAALGTASHFNPTPTGQLLYRLMGAGAVFLTSATLVFGALIWRSDRAPFSPALHVGLVAGLLLTFALTLLSAGFISTHGSHSVGGATSDAGGLALMGWSRDGGDLRVAHFFSTHAMHALPLLGWVAGRAAPAGTAARLMLGATVAYAAFCIAVFAQALAGEPFLSWMG
jgi:hypothetical protein